MSAVSDGARGHRAANGLWVVSRYHFHEGLEGYRRQAFQGATILNKFFLFTVLLGTLALGLLACELTPESLSASLAETAGAETTVRVTGAVVNLRAGPSVQYAVLGQVEAGDRLPVTGISRNRTWLQVQTEAERRWIFADLTDVTAELRAELAEVAAPALEGSVSTSAGQSTKCRGGTGSPDRHAGTG